MDKPKLTDLIDVEILQKMQDGFSALTGMAALITDEEGIPITTGSNFCDYCKKYTRRSEIGSINCGECDKQGALVTLKEGRPFIYSCHAGLYDYSAPILLEDRVIGSFVGGQVLTRPLDEEVVRRTAVSLGIDEEELLEAAKGILIKDKDAIQDAANLLYYIGGVISDMAYKSNDYLKKNRKLERAAQSQTDFITDMNAEFKNNMNIWIKNAKTAVESGNADIMEKTINQLLIKGPELVSDFSETIEYAKLTDGKLELNETEYSMDNLLRFVCGNVEALLEDKAIVIIRQVDDDVPRSLLGDEGRIGQVISKLLMSAVKYTDEGVIDIHVSSKKVGYATYITITIADDGAEITPDDLSMVSFLVKQMSGDIEVECNKGEGTKFLLGLPQLAI
ncbi:MAG: PocR ligand-binding domain-containing protein [Clostridium sp.]|nr:PocR ligand-binding domain-containing protein [Clostridium sp.]